MARFSSRTIAKVRQIVGDTLTDVCDIDEQTTVTGSMGQVLQSWTTRSSGVMCRLIRAGASNSSDSGVQGGAEVIEDSVRIILPYGSEVAVDYRLVVADGESYQVVAIEDALSDKGYVSVIGKRIR